jgi:hypothetical protein
MLVHERSDKLRNWNIHHCRLWKCFLSSVTMFFPIRNKTKRGCQTLKNNSFHRRRFHLKSITIIWRDYTIQNFNNTCAVLCWKIPIVLNIHIILQEIIDSESLHIGLLVKLTRMISYAHSRIGKRQGIAVLHWWMYSWLVCLCEIII